MWRQVQIEVNQARNLGTSKPLDVVSDVASDSEVATDGVDMEVSCEVGGGWRRVECNMFNTGRVVYQYLTKSTILHDAGESIHLNLL